MSYFLFLDDLRLPSYLDGQVDWSRYDQVRHARSFEEFVETIEHHGLPSQVSFDHDLGEDHLQILPSGMDCAHWLVNHCLDNELVLPAYQVHSSNPPGRANILGLLDAFRRHQSPVSSAPRPA